MAKRCSLCGELVTWTEPQKTTGKGLYHIDCHKRMKAGEEAPERDGFRVEVEGLGDVQQVLFLQESRQGEKDTTTGVLLAIFLGGLGAHRYYLGDWLGLLYLVFCWTFIPSLVGLLEAFVMPDRVREYNRAQAKTIAARIKAATPTPVATPTSAPSVDERERVPCPECAELILKAARRCRYCGAILIEGHVDGLGGGGTE